jgi:hypothetical protein
MPSAPGAAGALVEVCLWGCTPKPGWAGRWGGNRDVQLLLAAGVAALMAWRRVLQARVVQIRHRAEIGPAWRQPSRSPRQSPPAATVRVGSFLGRAALHRPLGPPQPVQLRRQWPGAVLQVLQVAAAVERPSVGTARPATPIAGLRGARTGVVRLGPAAATASLVDPRARREGDLPGPASLPAAHEMSPPLAWFGLRPTHQQAGTAKPEPHRGTTVLPAVIASGSHQGSGLKAPGQHRWTAALAWEDLNLRPHPYR